MARSLYICYFGVREPLVQTQVIPYLRELVKGGHEMLLVTFEAQYADLQPDVVAGLRNQLAGQGIEWFYLSYHKRFSAAATAWDILQGARFVKRMIATRSVDILHGRSHVATLIGALGRKMAHRKPKLLFDIRGFFPEEYTDAGIWPAHGLLYRSAKRVERWLLRQADGFVVLTGKAKQILFAESEERPVEVIPCCVDLKRFETANYESRVSLRRSLGLGDRLVAVYLGAFGGWYLTEETADLLGAIKKRRSDTFAMILTQSDPEMITPLLRRQGFSNDDFLIRKVSAADVPRYLVAADIAISLIKNCYSKQASSPTKNAEYLACGLPIIANAGVGDVDELIEGRQVGTLIRDLSPAGYAEAIDGALAFTKPAEHMRSVAASEFALDPVGGEGYRRLYSQLLETTDR